MLRSDQEESIKLPSGKLLRVLEIVGEDKGLNMSAFFWDTARTAFHGLPKMARKSYKAYIAGVSQVTNDL